MREHWTEISENLKKMLDSGVFKVWVAPLQAVVEGDCLQLTAPSAFVAHWLEHKMLSTLQQAAAPVLGLPPAAVKVRVRATAERPRAGTARSSTVQAAAAPVAAAAGAATARPVRRAEQAPLPLPLHASGPAPLLWCHSFADFVVGPPNRMAVAAAQDMSQRGGRTQTLFVSSAPGLGKTHLTQAVGRAMADQGNMARVGYLTAEAFATRFVCSLKSHDVEGFKSRFRDLDVLLMEDVHFFQGKEKMQDMALAVVKNLQARGGRVIFTSSFSPRELQHVDSQLVSHFCSGILTDMGRPTEEMRRHILERKARSFQVLLPDPVCQLLASRLNGDVRQLESCLNSLIFKARLLNCELNVNLAMEVLSQYASVTAKPDFPTILRLVCQSFGLNERQLASRSRRRECTQGRNLVYYLARKHTALTLEQIGERFNRRHSTVIKGITAVERELSGESGLGRQLARAVQLIERNVGLPAAHENMAGLKCPGRVGEGGFAAALPARR